MKLDLTNEKEVVKFLTNYYNQASDPGLGFVVAKEIKDYVDKLNKK